MQIKDEAEAWTQVKAGKESGLRWLFDRYYRNLLIDAGRLLPDADACQDMVQEAFAELWRRREELDIQSSVGAYLRRMVINRTLNHIKAQKRYSFGDEAAWAGAADALPEPESLRGGSLEEAIRLAIQRLPEKCRLVFSLSRFEQMSNKEIAQQLEISIKTVENQMTKALRILRESLKNRPDLSCVIILAINSAALT